MWTRAPVARAASMTCAMAVFSAPRGRDARNWAYRGAVRGGGVFDGAGVLGVHDHQAVELADRGEVGGQVGRGQRRELRDAGVEQEAFEAEHARFVQAPEVVDVPGDGATPEAHIDVGLLGGHGPFDLQGGDVHGGRQAVQGHVDDGGDAAGRGRAGRRGEAFPFGAAGFVDVHVGVHQAGQQHLVVGQLDAPPGRQVRVDGFDRGDPAVADRDGGRAFTGRGDRATRAEHQVEVVHVVSPPCDTRSCEIRCAANTVVQTLWCQHCGANTVVQETVVRVGQVAAATPASSAMRRPSRSSSGPGSSMQRCTSGSMSVRV